MLMENILACLRTGAAFGFFGLLDAAVVCLGAGGGVTGPATKSNIGRSFSNMPYFSARVFPESRGTQVPIARLSTSLSSFRSIVYTLIFAIASLYLFVDTLLNLPFQYPCASWLIVVTNF